MLASPSFTVDLSPSDLAATALFFSPAAAVPRLLSVGLLPTPPTVYPALPQMADAPPLSPRSWHSSKPCSQLRKPKWTPSTHVWMPYRGCVLLHPCTQLIFLQQAAWTPTPTGVEYPAYARTIRMDFPIYEGRKDPLPWLTHCDIFFRQLAHTR
ncbi:hypothetical protein KSP39_PZI001623 [Platanthera zijinensis]|uniref:Uncharacterized protein n=1 Tax=Platanthera zijinensis TaxID=2320716 RepID=A0AAP0GEK9_9ASPA